MRRRTRLKSEIRTKIRMRVWMACLGALIVMTAAIYFVLGREGASRLRDSGVARSVVAAR